MEYGFNLTWGSEAMSEIIWVTGGLSWNAFIYNNHVPTLSSNAAVTLGSNSFKKLLFCFPFMKIVRYKLNMHFNQAHFCLHLVRHVSVIVGHGWCLERHPEWVWHEQISVCSLCTQELRPHCQKKRTIEIPRNPVLFLLLDAFHSSVALAEGLSLLFWPCQLFESQCCFIST